jgi:hypothetical protein
MGNGYLNIKLMDSKDKMIYQNTESTTTSLLLEGSRAEILGPILQNTAHTAAKFSFTLINNDRYNYIFGTRTIQEMEDWTESLKLHSQKKKDSIDSNSSQESSSSNFSSLSAQTHFSIDSAKLSDQKSSSSIVEKVSIGDSKGNTSKRRESKRDKSLSMTDFEVHRVLGRGKFGKVLLCSQKTTKKVYAIKVVLKHDMNSVEKESKVLRSIQHPFIVSLHAAFETASRLYLVMDYVNAGEMYFHVSNFGRFGEERACFYAGEIQLALQCLHGSGIIYRDLKLENILLNRYGHVQITDFGLARTDDEQDDDSKYIVGTLEYLVCFNQYFLLHLS